MWSWLSTFRLLLCRRLADRISEQVNPVYQRRGIGARLIVWGIEQATEEKVPVTLSASTVAEPLYRKMGFKTWKLTDLPGVRMGAPSLIWWPEVLTATEAVKK